MPAANAPIAELHVISDGESTTVREGTTGRQEAKLKTAGPNAAKVSESSVDASREPGDGEEPERKESEKALDELFLIWHMTGEMDLVTDLCRGDGIALSWPAKKSERAGVGRRFSAEED
jgi:hypothetical protein